MKAAVATAWVKPVTAITGQDHLGTIAPAESIYVEQLPGITNVTARARYYSFYPWFLRELEQRKPDVGPDGLSDMLRRAECLFALASIRHARVLDEDEALHGATMVGREKLVPAVDELEGALNGRVKLAAHADREDESARYFQNALGGLGQYYLGPMRELGILGGDTRTRDIRYTTERGLPLAETFGAGVDAERFFELLDRKTVTLGELDSLASFCPCGLTKNHGERDRLLALLADPKGDLADEALARRSTVALVLDLVSKRAAPEYDFTGEFRAATYAGSLLDGTAWSVPEKLAESRRAWAAYARHELLSIAFQGLFWAALEACEGIGRRRFRGPEDLAKMAVTQLRAALPKKATSFGAFVDQLPLPALVTWGDEAHEVQAGWRIVERDSTPITVTSDALSILAALVARSSGDDPYGRLHFHASYFDRYPINLGSFFRRAGDKWRTMPVVDVVRDWLVWALRTHWRVALQKLAEGTPRDTFKVRPLDGDVLIVEAPGPTFSVPRIHRVVGLFRDLGVLTIDDDGRPQLTAAGKKLHGALLG